MCELVYVLLCEELVIITWVLLSLCIFIITSRVLASISTHSWGDLFWPHGWEYYSQVGQPNFVSPDQLFPLSSRLEFPAGFSISPVGYLNRQFKFTWKTSTCCAPLTSPPYSHLLPPPIQALLGQKPPCNPSFSFLTAHRQTPVSLSPLPFKYNPATVAPLALATLTLPQLVAKVRADWSVST